MEELPTLSWYVARRFNIPTALAGLALDRISGDQLRIGGSWGDLAAMAVPVGPLRSPAECRRRLRGRLRTPHRRAVRVELELNPWSTSTCELGLRPATRLRGARGEAYFATANASLERLGLDLVAALAVRRYAAEEVETETEFERAS